jgi:hypothetical protein
MWPFCDITKRSMDVRYWGQLGRDLLTRSWGHSMEAGS